MTGLFAPTFDQTPVVDATLDDLDLRDVEQHISYSREQGRYKGRASEVIPFLVEQRAVAESEGMLRPTVAGLLFFGYQPQRLLPYATTKLAHYRADTIDSTNVRHIDEYAGNVQQQVDRVVDYLLNHTERGYVLEGSAQRQERPQYPLAALRELTVNAISHRDYTVLASSVRVAMFPNRIEWVSPGTLPPGVTPDNILDMQYARNPNLTQLLYQRGYVEAYGQGLDTVFNLLQAQGLALPTMREAGDTFVITIKGHLSISLGTESLSSLTDPQLLIVAFVRRQRSATPAEIIAALPERSERSIQYDLKMLVEKEVLKRIGKGRATTYILPIF